MEAKKVEGFSRISMIRNVANRIRGIIPPMTTPFDEGGTIMEEAFRDDVRYLIEDARVHGLAVTGSTGEGHTVSMEETRQVTAWAVQEAGGRVPVITGIITNSTKSAVERGLAVRDLGVAALQVTPVHYLFRPDDAAMQRHFATIAEKTGLPVIIYNVVPWSYVSPAQLTKIVTEEEGVIGVKQSAGDLKLMADLCLMLRGRGVVAAATDALLYSAYAIGADASIAACLTAAPTLYVEMWNAVQKSDHTTGRLLHERLLPLWNAIEGDNLPANVKTAMELQGRPAGKPRPPMQESSPAQKGAIQEALEEAGLI